MKIYKDEVMPNEIDQFNQYEILKRIKFYENDNKFNFGQKKSWVKWYCELHNIEVDVDEFTTIDLHSPISAFCRMNMLGYLFSEKQHKSIKELIYSAHKRIIERNLNKEFIVEKKEETIKNNTESLQDKINSIIESNDSVFDYLKLNKIGPRYTNKIMKHLEKEKQNQKYIDECKKWLENSKPSKKGKKKETPEDKFKFFKCCKDYFGISSHDKMKLVGSKYVVTYHIKNKILSYYISDSGIDINRSSLINFNDKLTKSYKCEDKKLLIKISNGDKKVLDKIIKGLKEIECVNTGRINDYQLILNIFS